MHRAMKNFLMACISLLSASTASAQIVNAATFNRTDSEHFCSGALSSDTANSACGPRGAASKKPTAPSADGLAKLAPAAGSARPQAFSTDSALPSDIRHSLRTDTRNN